MPARPSRGTRSAARSSAPSSTPFSRAYGLARDELRYVLDPADALGPDYPSETFRVLKKNEIARFGDYRTAKLILAAWDRMAADNTFAALSLPEAPPA